MILEFFVIQDGKDVRVNIKPGETTWCDHDSSTKSMILYERKNLIKIKNDFEEALIVDVTVVPKQKVEFVQLDFKVSPTDSLDEVEEECEEEEDEDYEDDDFTSGYDDEEDDDEEDEEISDEDNLSPIEEAKKNAEEYKKDSEKKYKGKKRGRKKKRGPKPGSKRKKTAQAPTMIDKKDDIITTGLTS